MTAHAELPIRSQQDALRGLLLAGGTSVYGIGFDFAILALAVAVLVAIGARLYPTVAR